MTEKQYEIVLAAMADKISSLQTDLSIAQFDNDLLKSQLEQIKKQEN